MIGELVEMLAQAAVHAVYYEYVEHSGPPARYTMARPCGCGCGTAHWRSLVMVDGQSIHVSRACRMIVEPCDRVRFRPVDVVIAQWATT